MLRVLSSPRKLCNGMTRRDLIQAGALGMVGLGTSQFLELEAASKNVSGSGLSAGFGRAKRCIVLFLYGSPSQLETFDMKPHAPVEIRGTMKPIASSVPGLDVCEYLPQTAKIMDKVTVVRSMTHPHPIHGVAYAMTGVPSIDVGMELRPHDPAHQPYFGSVVEYIQRQDRGGKSDKTPQNVALPFPFSSQRRGEVARAGPYASYLGGEYNPIWTEYFGKATRSVQKSLGKEYLECFDPYVASSQDSHFKVSTTARTSEMTLDRLSRRRSLLEQFEGARRDLDQTRSGRSLGEFQELAFSLMTNPKTADALDVRRETAATRDLYGHTLFGQSCLAARRLVESGTRLVSVFWDEYGLAGDAWDTHWNHYPRMVDQLMPGFDKGFSGLIADLDQRGMLDDTLVVCVSEHGRTPRISPARNGGRDHWSRAYSAVAAGGGVARGRVIGATDSIAGDVTERPVSPKDLLATMYYALGIDHHATIFDRGGRPISLVPHENQPVGEMFA